MKNQCCFKIGLLKKLLIFLIFKNIVEMYWMKKFNAFSVKLMADFESTEMADCFSKNIKHLEKMF